MGLEGSRRNECSLRHQVHSLRIENAALSVKVEQLVGWAEAWTQRERDRANRRVCPYVRTVCGEGRGRHAVATMVAHGRGGVEGAVETVATELPDYRSD